MGAWVERLAVTLLVVLAALLSLAWILEDLLRRTAQTIDGFVPVADRLGEVGAAWRRLRAALRRARARWRTSHP
jgi:alkylation response protein AidB-like acyl-CoA dehydrogenase